MNNRSQIIPRTGRLAKASLAGCVFTAITALYFTAGHGVELIGSAVVFALAMVFSARLPRSRLLSAAIRLAVLLIVLLHTGLPDASFDQWYIKPEYTQLIGILLAAECAIRMWEPPSALGGTYHSGSLIFLSAIIIAAGSNTPEPQPIRSLGPLYIAFLCIALFQLVPRKRSRPAVGLARIMLLGLVLWSGSHIAEELADASQQLNNIAARFFTQQHYRMEIGLSGAPRLTAVYNPVPKLDRVMTLYGSTSERYMAALEFDHYGGGQWWPELRSRSFVAADARELRTDVPGEKLECVLNGPTFDLLPVPLNASSMETGLSLERDEFGAVRHSENNLFGTVTRYALTVPTNFNHQGPIATPPTQEQVRRALDIPNDFSPAVLQLARETAGRGENLDRVLRLVAHLRAHHGYSMKYDPGSGEPISTFILSSDGAHCEYFASALVIMSRAIGVPARLVTGFYAHERSGSNQLVVRQRDAHAWVECWIEKIGWVTLDATPAGGRPDSIYSESSALRHQWEWLGDLPDQLRDWLSQVPVYALVALIAASTVLLFGIFVLRLLWSRRRSGGGRRTDGYSMPSGSVAQLARSYQRWLKRNRMPCEPSQSWRECVDSRVAQQLEFLNAYDAVRFGQASEPALRRAQRALSSLQAADERAAMRYHTRRERNPFGR